jgi:hypothetical protein
MSGNDLVRLWKDPDEHGDAAHPAGDISLDDLSGGLAGGLSRTFAYAGVCPENSLGVIRCPDPWVAMVIQPRTPPQPGPYQQ